MSGNRDCSKTQTSTFGGVIASVAVDDATDARDVLAGARNNPAHLLGPVRGLRQRGGLPAQEPVEREGGQVHDG